MTDPIAQAERDRDYSNQMTLALLEALKPFRPTPAHVAIDALVKVLASHLATLPEAQKEQCIGHVRANLAANVEFFQNNPVLKVVKPT